MKHQIDKRFHSYIEKERLIGNFSQYVIEGKSTM